MKKGILLLNMGGPNNLDEVEVFLKNMFNDKNIITVKSDLLRKMIAFFIVRGRKSEAQENYKKIGGFSPIVAHTKRLCEKLEQKTGLKTSFAMAYTPPFVKDALKDFSDEELIVLPLYPQYSTTTVKSSLEDFDKQNRGFKYELIDVFYKDQAYNKLIVSLIKQTLANESANEYELIFSAHSLPQSIVKKGDPYQKQVIDHVELLKQELEIQKLNFANIHLAYQSKLGPVKWLEPELGETLQKLTDKKVLIYPLSFTIDNSETDFELSIEYKQEAQKFGLKTYKVCKCPNASDEFVEVLSDLVKTKVHSQA